jgi:hypothetical protein
MHKGPGCIIPCDLVSLLSLSLGLGLGLRLRPPPTTMGNPDSILHMQPQ